MSEALKALVRGASSGNIELMEDALGEGAPIDEPVNSMSALQEAARNDQPQAFLWLLDHGADINATRHPATVARLIIQSRDGAKIWEPALAAGAALDDLDEKGFNLLHLAAAHEKLWAVESLLGLGFDPNGRSKAGLTPLHRLALVSNDFPRSFPLYKALLDAGADLDAEDRIGCRPIHRAVAKGFGKQVQMLVALGASTWGVISSKDDTNAILRGTPLRAALKCGVPELLLHALQTTPGMNTQAALDAIEEIANPHLIKILRSWAAQSAASDALLDIHHCKAPAP